MSYAPVRRATSSVNLHGKLLKARIEWHRKELRGSCQGDSPLLSGNYFVKNTVFPHRQTRRCQHRSVAPPGWPFTLDSGVRASDGTQVPSTRVIAADFPKVRWRHRILRREGNADTIQRGYNSARRWFVQRFDKRLAATHSRSGRSPRDRARKVCLRWVFPYNIYDSLRIFRRRGAVTTPAATERTCLNHRIQRFDGCSRI